jgi:hypothetical protein
VKKVWHPWYKWECAKAGFYSSFAEVGISKETAQDQYREFLSDLELFEETLKLVISEWKYSCEHFLTDQNRNRIAWLGQASMAYVAGIPAEARSGYKLLTEDQQVKADNMANKYLSIWTKRYNDTLTHGNRGGIQLTYQTKSQKK